MLNIEFTRRADGRSLLNDKLSERSSKVTFNNLWSGKELDNRFITDGNFEELFAAVDNKFKIFAETFDKIGFKSGLKSSPITGLVSERLSTYRIKQDFANNMAKSNLPSDGHITGRGRDPERTRFRYNEAFT